MYRDKRIKYSMTVTLTVITITKGKNENKVGMSYQSNPNNQNTSILYSTECHLDSSVGLLTEGQSESTVQQDYYCDLLNSA